MKQSEYVRRMRKNRSDAGYCPICPHKREPEPGRKWCRTCLDSAGIRSKRYAKRLKERKVERVKSVQLMGPPRKQDLVTI